MSSHQITALAMQQQAFFGNAAAYAQQITPPRSGGGYVTGGAPQPPQPMMAPQPGYSMPMQGGMLGMADAAMSGHAQYAPQVFGEQLAGGGISAMQSMMGGIHGLANMGTMAAGVSMMGAGALGAMGIGGGIAGLTALPMIGAPIAALGSMAALPIVAGLGGAAWSADQVGAGFQERQAVGQVMRNRFGGMGIGQGRGGSGFNAKEMGSMSTMVREMSGNDMYTGFDELTRTLDRTGQMGLYRGVQTAGEFREKFKKTVESLKEIAKTMHTSLEEATTFMEAQRSMGFFSGKDISDSLTRTRLSAGASGMSVGQMQQIGMQGSQTGRMMGMRGRSGAQAMQEMATNAGIAMQTGVLSDEMVAEATGGAQGAEGAQILAGRRMQAGNRFFSRGAGRALLAGLWDPETGGINQDALQQSLAGGMSFRGALGRGRANIRATGGHNSEFFAQQERISGELMSTGQGMNVMLGMMEGHYGKRGWNLEDPAMQRSLRKRFGRSQAEIEADIAEYRALPRTMAQRRMRFNQQADNEQRTQAREGSGVGGFTRRLQNTFEKEVENPLRQAGDDLTTAIASEIEQMRNDLEGRIQVRVTEAGQATARDIASGRRGARFSGLSVSEMRTVRAQNPEGTMANLGRRFGIRGQDSATRLKSMGISTEGMSAAAIDDRLDRVSRERDISLSDLGLDSGGAKEMGDRLSQIVTMNQEAGRVEAPGLWGQLWGETTDVNAVARTRVEYLRGQDADFARRTSGMTEQQRIGAMQTVIGDRLKGKFALPGLEGGGSTGFADLASLAAAQKTTRGQLGRMVTRKRTAAESVGKVAVTGVGRWGGFLAGSVLPGAFASQGLSMIGGEAGRRVAKAMGLARGALSGDMSGLIERAHSNPPLLGQIEKAMGGDVAARTALANMAEDPDADLSESHREALSALMENATNPEVKKVFEQELRQTASMDDTLIRVRDKKIGARLEDFVGTRQVRIKGAVGAEGLAALNSLAAFQRAGTGDTNQLNERRRAFVAGVAGKKGAGELQGILAADTTGGGTALAEQLRVTDTLLQKFDQGSGRRAGGRGGAFLRESLVELGIDPSGLRQKDMQAFQKGALSADDIMETLRKTKGLEKTTVSDETLKNWLGDVVSAQKSGGTMERKEALSLGLNLGGGRAEALRQSGDRSEADDLPDLARKQVAHLSDMVTLTKQLVTGNKLNADAISKLNLNVDITTPPAGDVPEVPPTP